MIIKEFYDTATFTLTYVVHNEGSEEAVVIDPVMDFDQASGSVKDDSVKQVLSYLREHDLDPKLCIETHAHADHLSGSQLLKKAFPDMKVAISNRITQVQEIFSKAFNVDMPTDGSQFDYLFKDDEILKAGNIEIKAIPTPGHTPACSSFLIEDALFSGDAVFMPDFGVGRCDFPGGSAGDLYDSISKNIYSLPSETRVFVGHDYQPNGRELKFETTVGELKETNIQLNASESKEGFVTKREARDKTLSAPKLLLPSIQVNILAGHLPEAEDNGVSYLKLPLKELM